MKRFFYLVVAVFMMFVSSVQCGNAETLSATQIEIRRVLQEIAVGRGDINPLSVTYDDIGGLPVHGLSPGLLLAIHGDGLVVHQANRVSAGKPKFLTPQDIVPLAALLVKQEAWLQHTPEKVIPDKVRATLTIQYGDVSVQMWEWGEELDKNQRLKTIRDFMIKTGWEALPK